MFEKIRNFFWDNADTDDFIEIEEKERKYKLLKYALIITFPLTLFYSYLFFYNESYINAWIQLFIGLSFSVILIAHLRTKNTKKWAPFYSLFAALSIYFVIYFTGGLNAVALPWIISHGTTCVLLAGKRNGLIWWFLDFSFLAFIGALHLNEHDFPPQNSKFTSTVSNILNSILGQTTFLFLLAIIFENGKNRALKKLNANNKLLAEEKDRSESLLLNILPENVANELKREGVCKAKYFESVSVLFTDFVNFTGISENLNPEELVQEIDTYFKEFDYIIERNGLEKIKTIGDAYLAVCGLPLEKHDHAIRTVNAAKEIIEFTKKRAENGGKFNVRVGIHSGSLVAGVVGIKKFAYDIWGDTVNTASRMESNDEPNRINISEATYELIKKQIQCEYRGKIEAKNKGKIDMYFVSE